MRSNTRSTAFNAARMAYRWPWQPGAVGAGAAAAAGLAWHLGVDQAAYGVPLGVSVTGGATAWWWTRHVMRPHSTRALVTRRAEVADRAGGVATRLDVAEVAGPAALRRCAHVLRPSLAGMSRWQRRRLDPRAVGVEVARLGFGWWGESVWSPCEDATLRVAGPRSGKTTSLICHGLDAPGALVTTSTRLDLAEGVHAARQGRGPVHVFNPAGLGGLTSTVRWRVLSGCEDFPTACRRADDLIPPSTSVEAERWDTRARLLLGLLLHAAAVSGRSMSDVRRWAAGSGTAPEEVRDALIAVRAGGRDRLDEWRDYCSTNDKTRTSISNTMGAAVAWVSDDLARSLGDAPAGDPRILDVRDLISGGQTLHLIGHESNTRFAPLVAALVAEIAHTARQVASHQAGGRLDPPLTMLLDEAAIACPVPLDAWTADMGGRGVTLHISVQSLAQLRARWGDEGAATILANVGTLIAYGGSPAAGDLRDLSLLTGDHTARDSDPEGTTTTRRAPVLSPAEIRSLSTGQALVLRRGLRPFIGWTPTCLHRKGWAPLPLPRSTPPAAASRIDTADLEAMFAAGGAPVAQPDGGDA